MSLPDAKKVIVLGASLAQWLSWHNKNPDKPLPPAVEKAWTDWSDATRYAIFGDSDYIIVGPGCQVERGPSRAMVGDGDDS